MIFKNYINVGEITCRRDLVDETFVNETFVVVSEMIAGVLNAPQDIISIGHFSENWFMKNDIRMFDLNKINNTIRRIKNFPTSLLLNKKKCIFYFYRVVYSQS
jgi:hypothetical protein